MNYKLLVACLLLISRSSALEFVKQFENEKISVSYVKIFSQEEIGLHYDVYPAVVIALQGGIITRLEADGSTTDVEFPTGQSIFRPSEAPERMHKSVNKTDQAIELIIVELKN